MIPYAAGRTPSGRAWYSPRQPVDWRLDRHDMPKQPDGVSCGVCVLLMLELLARNPMDFYTALTSQPHWSPEHIAAARAKYACELLVRPNRTWVENATELGRLRLDSERQEGRGRAGDLCRDVSDEKPDDGSDRYRGESDEESDDGSDPNRHVDEESDDDSEQGA